MPTIDDGQSLCNAILDALGAETAKVALHKGDTLFHQGDAADAVYIVLTGALDVVARYENGSEMALATVGPGEPVGELGVLAGGQRTATVLAAEDCELVRVSRDAFGQLTDEHPELIAHLADIIRRRLRRSRLAAVLPQILGPFDTTALQEIEERVEWVPLRGGDVLCRQGDAGDCLYILVSGRLRIVAEDDSGNTRVLNEVAPGELIGEMGVITGEPRSATVYAIRDSVLAQLSKTTCQELSSKYPQLMIAIAHHLANRLRRSQSAASVARPVTNVALVPIGAEAALGDFATRLAGALSAMGPTLRLSSARLDGLIGMRGAAQLDRDAPRRSRLVAWLDEQEARHRFILFEADPSPSNWTRRCIRQADEILLVAPAAADPEPCAIEAEILQAAEGVADPPRTLVLLHPDGGTPPSDTSRWLAPRQVQGHCHVRMDTEADVGRLARRLAGTSVGLVLGGGGARGIAHCGVVRALREAGVPVDLIGGTSMGAVVGAAIAGGMSYEELLSLGKEIFVKARPHKEYTLPMLSVIRSRRLDAAVKRVYGDGCIEDLWLPFFCVSCNLTTCEMVVHRRGPVWKAVRASASIPGVFVPVLDDDGLLVDGGVLNNLPGDLMRQFTAGPVIVVEASPDQDLTVECEELPSPWELLWQRIRPPQGQARVPGIIDIMMRTIIVSSAHRARLVKADADVCLRPPIQGYGMLAFEAIDEIAEVGYQYARQKLAEMREDGTLEGLTGAG